MSEIKTRADLIASLREAAELEHGLLLQYLFAALTLKRDTTDNLSAHDAEVARRWAGLVLRIARQEMGHLAMVCNMLSAIGAAPHFGRPNFPQPEHTYYPFGFSLEAFTPETLRRFLRFEQPKGEPLPWEKEVFLLVGEVPVYEYVGELYGEIRSAFLEMDEKSLFIGPRFAQDTDAWANPGRFRLLLVRDRDTAKAAIDFIVAEGEGAPKARQGSHFDVFCQIFKEWAELEFRDLAHPVAANPALISEPVSGAGATIIKHEPTRRAALLFNDVYEICLLLLAQYYSFGGETAAQRAAIQLVSRTLMSTAVRPIAEILVRLPIDSADAAKGTAGPTFQLVHYPTLPAYVPSRFIVLIERLLDASQFSHSLSDVDSRFSFIAENLFLMAERLRRVGHEGTP